MKRFLLDTNIISDLIRHPNGIAAQRVEHVGHGRICTSFIVAAELRYGAAKSGSPKLIAKVEAALSVIPVLPLDVPADRTYGRIRAELEAAGKTIGANDLLIAAQAVTQGLTLVTANLREFERVRDLTVENWIDPQLEWGRPG